MEQPHNIVHGVVGGIMASYQSSFHPVFWLHHCNVDRLYEAYLHHNPDAIREFEQNQKRLAPEPTRGFPEGRESGGTRTHRSHDVGPVCARVAATM